MSYEFAKKEIGDYRITIYQDEDAECPCTEWDLAGVYFWDYSDYGYNRELSRGCSSEVEAENAEAALKELVCKYVPQKKIIKYINSMFYCDHLCLEYDKSCHMWSFERKSRFSIGKNEWYNIRDFTPNELKNEDVRDELTEELEEDDFINLLENCKDIAFYEWSSSGYSQGDYVIGYAYCDKERFKKMVDTNTKNWKLFRRWVMSQMFHMLRDMEKDGKSFNEVLQKKGYEYQWRMLENELHAQMKMCDHKDYENTKARNRWFNGCVAHDMAIDYINKLRSYIDDKCIYTVKEDKDGKKKKTYKHTCKGNPYIRLQNENIFVADLERKVYNPLRDLANKMSVAETYKELYDAVRKFNKNRKHLAWNTKQADAFITAYKGSGSYYTMRNIVMFHGARFLKNGRKMSETNSLKELESKAKLYDEEGWKMLGVLKQLIKDNNISVQGKILEWKKDKSENK